MEIVYGTKNNDARINMCGHLSYPYNTGELCPWCFEAELERLRNQESLGLLNTCEYAGSKTCCHCGRKWIAGAWVQ